MTQDTLRMVREALGTLEEAGAPPETLETLYAWAGLLQVASDPEYASDPEHELETVIPTICPTCGTDSAEVVNILSDAEVQVRCPNGHVWSEAAEIEEDDPSERFCPFCDARVTECDCH